MAYNLRTNEILLHGKFQPPNFNGVAVHRLQAEVQTKRGLSNICLDNIQLLSFFTDLQECTTDYISVSNLKFKIWSF